MQQNKIFVLRKRAENRAAIFFLGGGRFKGNCYIRTCQLRYPGFFLGWGWIGGGFADHLLAMLWGGAHFAMNCSNEHTHKLRGVGRVTNALIKQPWSECVNTPPPMQSRTGNLHRSKSHSTQWDDFSGSAQDRAAAACGRETGRRARAHPHIEALFAGAG